MILTRLTGIDKPDDSSSWKGKYVAFPLILCLIRLTLTHYILPKQMQWGITYLATVIYLRK